MIMPIAVTPGEPAGVGPELLLKLAQQPLAVPLVAIAATELLAKRAAESGIDIQLKPYQAASPPQSHVANQLPVLDVPLRQAAICGQLAVANSAYVLDTLRVAVKGCVDGSFHALTTGPVHKGIINESGEPFSGHTEFLGDLLGTEPVMMLATGTLRVALVTTHLPLSLVSAAITAERLESVIHILQRDLSRLFSIRQPRIAVAGLNPHAGEGGHLGREEIDVIKPVLDRLTTKGLQLKGPLPADTLFTPPVLAECDAVLAMYHDQGLPVLKHTGFGRAVNITLGLPIIRTSVDHGTALDLAGTGKASFGSLLTAINMAAALGHSDYAAPAA